MVATRALLGPISAVMGRKNIERLLASEGGMDVVSEQSWPGVISRLGGEAVDVVIAEFYADDAPTANELLELRDSAAVIELDLGSPDTLVYIRHAGSHLLVALASWLARARAGEVLAPPAKPRSAVVELRPLDDLGRRPTVGYLNHEDHLADVREWLNLTFSLLLARTAGDGEAARDFPGWTMSGERARALLGEANANRNVADLTAARSQVEARLEIRSEAVQHPEATPLHNIAQRFELDSVERRMLWLALAPEIEDRYARVIGFLNDDLTRRRPNLALMSGAIDEAGGDWRLAGRLAEDRPLGRFGLIALDTAEGPGGPRSQAGLACPEDIVELALTGRSAGARGDGSLLLSAAGGAKRDPLELDEPFVGLAEAASLTDAACPVVLLSCGPAAALSVADTLSAASFAVLYVDVSRTADPAGPAMEARLLTWVRQAILQQASLMIVGLDELVPVERARMVALLTTLTEACGLMLIVQSRSLSPESLADAPGGVMAVEIATASRSGRATLWRRRAAAREVSLTEAEALRLASTFAFDRAGIDATLAVAVAGRSADEVDEGAVRRAASYVARSTAPPSVRRLETTLGWDALVLPEALKAELKAIPAQIERGAMVWDTWGFASRVTYGQGVGALFAGPSGTGKTMAAQIIAREMGVPLFHVDLAQTVSKYIGETEKALERVFDAAERAGAVLLFDEADALFGKRSEVKDAHDRYANIEVAYLLQRMEAYRGLAVLTTNAKQSVDPAFLRRLRFVLDFPLPDATDRATIWKHMFPPQAPLAADVDLSFLARRLALSGGSIQQIALRAAFDAAATTGVIGMNHILVATRRELAKLGMQSAERHLTDLAPAPAAEARA